MNINTDYLAFDIAIIAWCVWWSRNWWKVANKENGTKAATWLAKKWLGRK